ncbi:hypothetical protein MPL1032_20700 [Mesorhizobium plurifarium]|uniref:Uncharacterized protein n=1 Tax=Mesorhizobium plurifarium TaxID=69974 RepID=A0A0K2VXQ2_MESPL|nr:hypothetical protein MPL1032_20700 [Mesorhizobium plurifarium]
MRAQTAFGGGHACVSAKPRSLLRDMTFDLMHVVSAKPRSLLRDMHYAILLVRSRHVAAGVF